MMISITYGNVEVDRYVQKTMSILLALTLLTKRKVV